MFASAHLSWVAERPLLAFCVCGHSCALPLGSVREVVAYAELSRPPGLPRTLDGFLNMGGTAVAVLRLDRLFDFQPTPPSLYTALILLRADGFPTALVVDSVSGILYPPAEAFAPLADHSSFNQCAEAEILLPDGPVHLLDAKRLLLEQERKAIAELQMRAQTYLDELEASDN